MEVLKYLGKKVAIATVILALIGATLLSSAIYETSELSIDTSFTNQNEELNGLFLTMLTKTPCYVRERSEYIGASVTMDFIGFSWQSPLVYREIKASC